MIEYWERSRVTGTGEKAQAEEIILHRRGADVVGMAMRRNPEMPKCDWIHVITVEAFMQIRRDEDGRKHRTDIPHDNRKEEWCW